ncbi:MAG: hypothetical protein DCF18_13370 [Cyanobium sp.]|uniref:hypothetical protein n=1 Tax=Synechococcus sp. CS-1333 TaxID=2848638 RepID=UPI000DBC3B0B|nr:hypothetical protein [Synechococcus sp. CS-1333]MCT0209310.1 hypothetical protein [Synechococcus sp. CS-1333]PZV20811.1 MAG: hypothetical protein DCF18_13370 [Cyanobium sp.]
MNPSQEPSAGSAAAPANLPAAEPPLAEVTSATAATPDRGAGSATGARNPGAHNFEIQKELHQRIRNDPDYDDWEYGTEPLPHEQQGWISRPAPGGAGASDHTGGAGVGVDAG